MISHKFIFSISNDTERHEYLEDYTEYFNELLENGDTLLDVPNGTWTVYEVEQDRTTVVYGWLEAFRQSGAGAPTKLCSDPNTKVSVQRFYDYIDAF